MDVCLDILKFITEKLDLNTKSKYRTIYGKTTGSWVATF